MSRPPFVATLAGLVLVAGIASNSAISRAAAPLAPAPVVTYADLADLADAAPLVAKVEIRDAVALKPEQTPRLKAGMVRLYVAAKTQSVLVGSALGESVSYLVDVPLDAKGKPPKLRKRQVIVFARPVAGRPGELQLVAPDAQLGWDPATETRLRGILTELVAPGAPPRVTGVREASHVAGNLVGEGETQIFLATAAGDPVSITVLRRPGLEPVWGVAFGEIVDQAARPPARDTLAWYRLACFLPPALATASLTTGDPQNQELAAQDYRFVRSQLGACPRTRSPRG